MQKLPHHSKDDNQCGEHHHYVGVRVEASISRSDEWDRFLVGQRNNQKAARSLVFLENDY